MSATAEVETMQVVIIRTTKRGEVWDCYGPYSDEEYPDALDRIRAASPSFEVQASFLRPETHLGSV